MFRQRFAIVVLTAALAACSDATVTGPTSGSSGPSTRDQPGPYDRFPGVLETPRILLSRGERISLIGWQTKLFQDLVGAEVLIQGTMDSDPSGGVIIHDFEVLAVDGMPVLDGTLEWLDDAYVVRGRDGSLNPLTDAPETLTTYIGRRVWVAQRDLQVVRYGVLDGAL